MTLNQSSVISNNSRRIVSIGNYRFTGKRLGQGNFAKVEEAVHSILNTKVAIKVMDTMSIKEDYVVRNLYREARIMSKLCHPCIVALFQTMQYGNLYYLVTELVGGGDLCAFIKNQRCGRLEERYTRVYARQLISAISHMHHIGIVHRDLKMENIMLNAIHTQIKIVDFGLSNFYGDDNPLRTHCGSPEYAAPELFVEGKHYGPEVDLWSLGVILYGMVIGQLPFNTSRCSTMSSQQRRKKLLEQINKGLGIVQRRALHGFTTEFKVMMARLLTADTSKRITIGDLIHHVWLTEMGRKVVRSNPLRRLDEQAQTCLIQEVGTLIQMEWPDVRQAIKYDPQCNVAGMYNMLEYKAMRQNLQGDGITKTLSSETPRTTRTTTSKELSSLIKTQASKDNTNTAKSAPVRHLKKKVIDGSISPRAGLNLRSRVLAAAAGDNRKISLPTPREITPTGFLSANSRKTGMQQESHRRKEMKSAPLKVPNEPNRLIPITISSRKEMKSAPLKVSNESNRLIPSSSRNHHHSPGLDVFNCKSSSARKSDSNSRKICLGIKILGKSAHSARNTADTTSKKKDVQCKSHNAAETTLRRPETTAEKKRSIDRVIIRKSLLPVLLPNASTEHQPRSSSSPVQIRNTRPSVASAPFKNKVGTCCDPQPIDQMNYNATGDAKKIAISNGKTAKSNFLNDPIARSIAGYVANNIPGKLPFQWLKTSKSGRS